MKTSIFTIILLLVSFTAQAEVSSYECTLLNEKDTAAVEALGLRNFNAGTLTVAFSQCKLTEAYANFDICHLGRNSLVIGVNPLRSVLLNRVGKAYEFSCKEKVVGGEEPQEEEEQEQQEQQQEESEEQQESEPGHGGSNIRMRGVKKE